MINQQNNLQKNHLLANSRYYITDRIERFIIEPEDYTPEKYFYDTKNRVYRKRADDQLKIIYKLNSEDKKVAKETANFIVDNLDRYARENRKLSAEGYEILSAFWSKIKQNSTYENNPKLAMARNYLISQEKIFNPHKSFPKPIKKVNRNGFFNQLRERTNGLLARFA